MNSSITVAELYTRVVADLERWEKKRQDAELALDEAAGKIQELTQMVSSLRSYLPEIASTISPQQGSSTIEEFSSMSTREAIKIVLQRANRALSSSEIANVLTEGGVKSESASFRSNVSATLSVMQSKYQEVIKTPQGWILSQPNLVNAESSSEVAA